jgi:hypothetical protein
MKSLENAKRVLFTYQKHNSSLARFQIQAGEDLYQHLPLTDGSTTEASSLLRVKAGTM